MEEKDTVQQFFELIELDEKMEFIHNESLKKAVDKYISLLANNII